MTKTIEQKVAEAVLQKPKEIVISDRTFSVAPPTVATLLLVSEYISLLPQITLNKERIVEEVLYIAKDCRVIGDILATLILGSKRLEEAVIVKKNRKNRFFRFLKKTKTQTIDRKTELSQWLLEELAPAQLYKIFFELIKDFQLGDFFGLTTFLTDINLLHQTKVVNETTASGQ